MGKIKAKTRTVVAQERRNRKRIKRMDAALLRKMGIQTEDNGKGLRPNPGSGVEYSCEVCKE